MNQFEDFRPRYDIREKKMTLKEVGVTFLSILVFFLALAVMAAILHNA